MRSTMDEPASLKAAQLRARAALLRERARQAFSQAFAETYLAMARDYEDDAAATETGDASGPANRFVE